MPAGPGKSQLNLTITAKEKAWLTERAAEYDDVSRDWYAAVLLRFGMRHAKQAWAEMTERAEARFMSVDDPP